MSKKFFGNISILVNTFMKCGGRSYFFTSMILSAITVPSNVLVSININQDIINAMTSKKPLTYIIVQIVIFQLLILVTSMIQPCYTYLYGEKKLSEIVDNIDLMVFKQSLKVDLKYFDDADFYDKFTYTLNEFCDRSCDAVNLLQSIVSIIVTLATLMTLVGNVNPIIIVITVITLLMSTWLGNKINKQSQNKNVDSIPFERQINYIHNVFCDKKYASDIKCTNVKRNLFQKYSESTQRKYQIINAYNRQLLVLVVAQNGIMCLSNIAIMLVLVLHIVFGTTAIGSFVGMLTAAIYMRSYLQSFFDTYTNIQKIELFMNEYNAFKEMPSNIENSGGRKKIDDIYSLQLNKVSFSYPNSQFCLKDINMYIAKGKKTAIVGRNGAGKTTLIKLLLRLYAPSSGEILINGISLDQFALENYRLSVGTAFQNSILYALSLRENINVYSECSDMDLQKAITEIELNSNGELELDAQVTKEFDNDGIVLSGGDTQKLALTRIFTKPFKLLILDEPTSSLDPLAEYKLNKKILDVSKKTTTVIVTHRLTTARHCDYIYVMENGEIVEEGTHITLMEKRGLYHDMFEKQAESYVGIDEA